MSLQERFPDLRPINSAPTLFKINGCGLGMYGRRDTDHETGTYIATHCLCLLFIPLFTLAAYRVADAENGGWYFIGKERLSTFARAWNVVVVLLALGGVGFFYLDKHWQSAEYLYAQKLSQAEQHLAKGDIATAARLFREVIEGRSIKAGNAVAAIDGWLAGPAKTAPLSDVEPMLQAAEAARVIGVWPGPADTVYQRGIEVAQARAEKTPQEAVKLVGLVEAGAPDATKLLALRQPWLEAWHQQTPKDIECAGLLAVCFESNEEFDKCKKLLEPFGQALVGTEGGRIWGQMLAREGKFVESCDFLLPYCTGRLEKLHQAEQLTTRLAEEAQSRAISRLDRGDAPQSFYATYKAASEDRQREMVIEYVMKELREDSALKLAQDKLRSEADIVPVALDLGMALLQRAQQATNADERKGDLEKAEKTFLAVGGVAGEADSYRLNLGQVYYWLGKPEEGRKLFDELIAAKGNDFQVALGIGQILREVGANTEASKMAEELYARESGQNKFAAAQLRALLHTDVDDEILWLQRCDPADKSVQASLHSTRGQKAISEGRDEEAIIELRKGAEIYAKMNESASSLNNAALCYFQLFRAAGDPADHQQATDMLEKAVVLLPGDSILLTNYTAANFNAALLDIVGDRLQWKTLRQSAGLDALGYLYDDQESRDKVTDQVRQSGLLKKVTENARRLQVIRPKSTDGYGIEVALLVWTEDTTAAEQLFARVKAATLDLGQAKQEAQDLLNGKDIAKRRVQLEEAEKRAKATLARARAANHPATLAMALCDMVEIQISANSFAMTYDADAAVGLAEEAVAAQPCLATRRMLSLALLERANQQLKATDQAYATAAQDRGTLVTGAQLIGIAVQSPGELRDKVLALPDTQRAIQQAKELAERLPDSVDDISWHLLKLTDSAITDQLSQENKSNAIANDVQFLLVPLSRSGVVNHYLTLLRRGDQANAKELLETARREGVTLPWIHDTP